MEVKASLEEGKRVGVVVSVLLEQGKGDAVEWVKRELKSAIEERQAWVDGDNARSAIENTAEGGAVPEMETPAPTIFLSHDTNERKEALFRDKFLRLFLDTLGCQRLGAPEDVDGAWIIPSEVTPAQIREGLSKIQSAEHDGVELDEGKTALDCLRNKSASSRRAAFEAGTDESEGDLDAPLFPPNLREKRKATEGDEAPKKKRRLTRRNHKELTEEELQEKANAKRKRDSEKNAKIKSALFVTESDDESDEERDREFFRLEEERRRKVKAVIGRALAKEAIREERGQVESEDEDGDGAARGGKGRKRKRKGRKDVESGDDVEMADEEDSAPMRRATNSVVSSDEESSDANSEFPRRRKKNAAPDLSSDDEDPQGDYPPGPGKHDWHTLSDVEAEYEDTPTTSPPALPLGEVSGNAAKGDAGVHAEADGDEELEEVVKAVSAARGRGGRRMGFIVEDDSDED